MENKARPPATCCRIAIAILLTGFMGTSPRTQQAIPVPQFKVDPSWPKSLPQVKDAAGQLRRWVTGGVGGVCIDSHDHIFTTNRGGRMGTYEGMSGILSPQVVVYDTNGAVIDSWAPHPKEGEANVLPEVAHGCSVDYEDNVWFTGLADGVAQKWSHDGKKMLLQIGVKGQCDGPPDASPKARYPTCGENGAYNSSRTLLNQPSNLWVDPGPDPVTNERGSVYIADGYGNHRVVVFDRNGTFLRQWGKPGKGPGQFGPAGDAGPGPAGGHPHCVALSKDGFLYACDRANNRIFEFDRMGNLKRTIPIDPPGGLEAPQRTADVAFSTDPQQTYLYTTDLGNNVIRILHRASGKIVGQIGAGPGRGVGELLTPHQLAVDSKGNVYVSSTADSNRVQRFIKQ
jgi:hypothetical protein